MGSTKVKSYERVLDIFYTTHLDLPIYPNPNIVRIHASVLIAWRPVSFLRGLNFRIIFKAKAYTINLTQLILLIKLIHLCFYSAESTVSYSYKDENPHWTCFFSHEPALGNCSQKQKCIHTQLPSLQSKTKSIPLLNVSFNPHLEHLAIYNAARLSQKN